MPSWWGGGHKGPVCPQPSCLPAWQTPTARPGSLPPAKATEQDSLPPRLQPDPRRPFFCSGNSSSLKSCHLGQQHSRVARFCPLLLCTCTCTVQFLPSEGEMMCKAVTLLFAFLLSFPFLGPLASAPMGFQITLLSSLSPPAWGHPSTFPMPPAATVPRMATPTQLGWCPLGPHPIFPPPNPALAQA